MSSRTACATSWIRERAAREEAISIYTKHIPAAPRPAAQRAYETMFSAKEGLQKKAKIDLEGCRTVLKLRSEFAKPQKNLTDPAKYIDESYYARAVR